MNAKLIKFVVFLSYFVNALVVENNGGGLNVYETTWKNPFDGGIENLKKAEIFEKKENEQQSFDSKKNDKKIVSFYMLKFFVLLPLVFFFLSFLFFFFHLHLMA